MRANTRTKHRIGQFKLFTEFGSDKRGSSLPEKSDDTLANNKRRNHKAAASRSPRDQNERICIAVRRDKQQASAGKSEQNKSTGAVRTVQEPMTVERPLDEVRSPDLVQKMHDFLRSVAVSVWNVKRLRASRRRRIVGMT